MVFSQIQKNSNYETIISAFNIILEYSIYINKKTSNDIYSPSNKKFTEIKSLNNFFGLNIISKFYFSTKNDNVLDSAFNTISNILELISKNEDERNSLINSVFNFISKNKNNFKNNSDLKIA